MSWIPRLVGLCLCASLTSGCIYSRHQTHTGRSATEQLLLTQSIERAVARLELPEVDGLDVAVDSKGRLYVADPGDGNVAVFAPKQ